MFACFENDVNVVGACQVTLGAFQPGFYMLENIRFLKKV